MATTEKNMEREFTVRGVKWKDATGYSQGDDERIPTAFSTKVGRLKITVTNGHIHHRPEFIFHCFEIELREVQISARTHKEAAEIAFDRCKERVAEMHKAFEQTN